MKRRDFIKTAAVSASLTGAATSRASSTDNGKLPCRAYGDTDVKLSVIGFGGIVVVGAEQEHANRVVAESVERGVNYFDVAPTYGRGEAETKLGPALEPYRKDSFLACKTQKRDAAAGRAEFEQSLERLKTDYFDLYQLHAITDVEKDVDAAFAKGGVMELLTEARKNGQIRYLGFSAHSEAAALAAMDRFDFDSVLFPFNFAAWYEGDFGPRVMETAEKKGVARLALKALARSRWEPKDPDRATYRKCWYEPTHDHEEARMALRFTLSKPITAAIPPGDESMYRMALDLAENFEPITEEEDQKLRALAASLQAEPIFVKA